MYADELLLPWLERMKSAVPGCRVFDSHTHIGQRDPGGLTAGADELVDSLRLADARALVFPMAGPDGYLAAHRHCAEVAAASDGRLVALVRLVPGQDPARMLENGLRAGARGIELHPSSDDFAITDPRLEDALHAANERRLAVVVHAGPELSSIGASALRLCRRYPRIRLVLAHCALTDLAWIWREVPDVSNLFFDTSWWSPQHLMALSRLVPPGRILQAAALPPRNRFTPGRDVIMTAAVVARTPSAPNP